MNRFTALLVVISLCFAGTKAEADCVQKVSESYLDAAIDMITKAKINYPGLGSRCENTLARQPSDCSELLQTGFNKSGVYKIWPASRMTEDMPVQVYCDMQTDDGGWTLIQRRGDFQKPQDYFYRDWKTYKEGFGDLEKDFWLGNDNIFALSNQKLYSVRFDLRDFENNHRYAHYDAFWIDDENQKYALHIAGYTGDAGDSMTEFHNNQKFSTKDQDNDRSKDYDCVKLYTGGWWYGECHKANLNGLYHRGKHESYADGVNWDSWKGYHESMKSTQIKIRPKKFKLPHALLSTHL